MSLWTRAEVAYRRGDKQRAVEPIEQALAEAREIGSIWLEREVLEALIERLHQLGRSDDAAQRQRELDALRSA